jgi:hypothetical protein
MGRPLKLTPDRRRAIVKSARIGATREDAAAAAGIHIATFYRWMEQGEADIEHGRRSVFRDLCEGVRKAEGKARVAAVGVVEQAIRDGNWQAGMTYLERRDPKHWARRLHVRDDTPRTPAPLRLPTVETFERAFAASFGDELPEIDPANLMPELSADEPSVDGSRNGSG